MELEYAHIKDIFSSKELRNLKSIWEKSLLKDSTEVQEEYGRITFSMYDLPETVIHPINNLVNSFSQNELSLQSVMSATYSLPYGVPNLPPHFDGDDTDMIVNFTLSSNTRWSIGLNETLHNVLDNGALLFNPNEYVHWRPHKEFKDGEYVSMIFFRYVNASSPSDYSNKIFEQRNPIFDKANKLRDSLK